MKVGESKVISRVLPTPDAHLIELREKKTEIGTFLSLEQNGGSILLDLQQLNGLIASLNQAKHYYRPHH